MQETLIYIQHYACSCYVVQVTTLIVENKRLVSVYMYLVKVTGYRYLNEHSTNKTAYTRITLALIEEWFAISL